MELKSFVLSATSYLFISNKGYAEDRSEVTLKKNEGICKQNEERQEI